MRPEGDGRGFSPRVSPTGRAVLGALLSPLWVPLLVVLVIRVFGPGLSALGLLAALFIFIPGVLVIANHGSWPRWVRFFLCMVYLALSEVVYFGVLYAVAQLFIL
jgi:hypothetical protein